MDLRIAEQNSESDTENNRKPQLPQKPRKNKRRQDRKAYSKQNINPKKSHQDVESWNAEFSMKTFLKMRSRELKMFRKI